MHLLPFLFMLLLAALTGADVVDDLTLRGVPALSASVDDSIFTVEIEGSLAMGDSLLKHYGGVFFLLVDSIAAGWDVLGMEVGISEAVLVFSRDDMFTAVSWLADGTPEETVALWILEHTLVEHR